MTRSDITLICISALLIGWLAALSWSPDVSASSVQIFHGSKLLQEQPLSKDRLIKVQGSLGISEIRIENHRARFEKSPCKNKVCMRSGWHEFNGETAACVPNRIVMRLAGRSEKDQIDGLAE